MKKHYSIQFKLAIPIILMALLVLGTMTFLMARDGYQTAEKGAIEKTVATAHAHANDMRLNIERGLDVSRNVAAVLEAYKKKGYTSRENITDALRELLVKDKNLIGT